MYKLFAELPKGIAKRHSWLVAFQAADFDGICFEFVSDGLQALDNPALGTRMQINTVLPKHLQNKISVVYLYV